jgi:mono/diheme cytochrome c family protein
MQSSSHPHQVWLALLSVLALLIFWQARTLAQGSSQEQLEMGARLYAENCAVCHGPNGEGRVGVTLAKDWPSIRPELLVKSVIEEGVPGSPMPAWSQKKGGPLSDEEIDALILYILSWETGGPPPLSPTPTFTPRPPITPVPEVEGDPNRGVVLYAENCAVCHGPNGEGRVGAQLDKVWPSIRPDLRIKTAIENGVSGSPMPAWGQKNGGPLTEQDINDIVAFVLSWQAGAVPTGVAPTPAPTPSILSGPLGVLVLVAGLLVLVLVGVIGALARKR